RDWPRSSRGPQSRTRPPRPTIAFQPGRDNPGQDEFQGAKACLAIMVQRAMFRFIKDFQWPARGMDFQGVAEELGGSSRVVGKRCQSINRPGLRWVVGL